MYTISVIMGAFSMLLGLVFLGILVVVVVIFGVIYLFGSKSDKDDKHKID
ncbi:hypothetical protein RJI07_07085 [Mycoplasmatota bacterium WC30]